MREGLPDFVSCHAPTILEHVPPVRRSEWMQAAVTYCETHGAVPSRRTAPLPFIARVCETMNLLALARLRGTTGEALPAPPFPPPREGALRGVAIDSVPALQAEGAEMHHCAATLAGSALAGRVAVYRLYYDDERLTLSVQKRLGRWAIGGLRGRLNREPSREARNAVAHWFARVRAQEQSRARGVGFGLGFGLGVARECPF